MSKSNKSAAVKEVVSNPIPVDEKGRFKEVRYSNEELEAKGWKNKSQIIRGLAAEGYAPAAIAKRLDIIYQHVRNVLNKPLKRVETTAEVAPKE